MNQHDQMMGSELDDLCIRHNGRMKLERRNHEMVLFLAASDTKTEGEGLICKW